MELIREKEFVNQYHYNARNLEWEKEHGAPQSNAEVSFQLLKQPEDANSTRFVAVLQFIIVKDEYVINGVISQINLLKDRVVTEPKEFTQAEVEKISAPLLDMLKRLTYEVTEIALDRPGVTLEF